MTQKSSDSRTVSETDLREPLEALLAFRHGDTKHLTQEHARILFDALRSGSAGTAGMREAGAVLQALYDSEINFSIVTFWDNGFEVKLGDEMNGFAASGRAQGFANAVEWLMVRAIEKYPGSTFAKNYRAALAIPQEKISG